MADHLLPGKSTDFEKALSLTTDVFPRLGQQVIDARGLKFVNTPESFLPFLVYEYGLGPITPYFDDLREVIAQGLLWQRQLGTEAAIRRALGWIGYDTSDVEAFPTRRRRWNLFMLAMTSLPAVEEPDLNDIEILTKLSVPLRSKFWRGFYGYDTRAVDYGYTKWGDVSWSTYSGARIREDGAKWSFGTDTFRVYAPTQADLTALGVWIAVGGAPLSWGAYSWADANASWASSTALTRVALMVSGTLARPVWIVFKNSIGAVIGYRRARIVRGVEYGTPSVYSVDGIGLVLQSESPRKIYIEALTDFGDGYGGTAASWALLFDALPVDETKPGLLWAGPGELTSGIEVMPTTQTIEFRRTVRERFRVLLNF